MFVLRFDLRIPPASTLTRAEQYRHVLGNDAIVTDVSRASWWCPT